MTDTERASRKIDEAIVMCREEIAKSDESDYGAGLADAYENILKILEGRT